MIASFTPSPACGGGLARGLLRRVLCRGNCPLPDPPPQAGEGTKTEIDCWRTSPRSVSRVVFAHLRNTCEFAIFLPRRRGDCHGPGEGVTRIHMSLLHLYARALALLGSDKKLGIYLAVANFALAGAMFAEPVLFGRIIDALAGAQAKGATAAWPDLIKLISAWIGFGLFTIVVGVTVALYADRLAHRRRQAVLTDFFDHVLQLPLMFHGKSHSGRLMKVMLAGTDALWSLWLDFFRDSFAAAASLLVLLPLSLYLNWPLGADDARDRRRVRGPDRPRHQQDGDAAAHRRAALFQPRRARLRHARQRRPGAGLRPHRGGSLGAAHDRRRSARGADPGAVVVGRGRGADPGVDHADHAGASSWSACSLHLDGRASDRRHRDVHEFRRPADRPAREIRPLRQQGVHGRAAAAGILHRARHRVGGARPSPDAVDPGRVHGLVEFKNVSFSYDGKRSAVARSQLSRRCPGKPSRSSAAPGPASRPRWRCCTAPSTRNAGRYRSTA